MAERFDGRESTPPVINLGEAHYMRLAMEQAGIAQSAGEVPVGAVIVDAQGEVIAQGSNSVLTLSDPTAHAEIVALRRAGQVLGNYRLPGLSVYVTLEPCVMCLGALFHARVSRVIYGAPDPKTGACGGRVDLTAPGLINHHCTVEGGLLAQECGQILTGFFRDRRLAQAAARASQNRIRHEQEK